MKFKELGFKDFKAYKEYFFKTILESNKTYDYFVDWKKVKSSLQKYVREISILNSLTKIEKNEIENFLAETLQKYPETIKILPLLLAERIHNKKIDIFDISLESIISFDFSERKRTQQEILTLIKFCRKTGLINLFSELKDIYDYIFGIEVGMDTNARKNRSGNIFEDLVHTKINSVLQNNLYNIKKEDPSLSLYQIITKGKNKGKRHDFVIYKEDLPFLIIECNYYNVPGSKPVSIAESYIEMAKITKVQNLEFLWITDGPGWFRMEESLTRAMNHMDWVINYKLIEKTMKKILLR